MAHYEEQMENDRILRELADIDVKIKEVERTLSQLHEHRREFINRHNLNKGTSE